MVYCIIVLVVLVIEENNICFLNFEQLFHKKKTPYKHAYEYSKIKKYFYFIFLVAQLRKNIHLRI